MVDDLHKVLDRRLAVAPSGNCPVELSGAFLRLCLAESCGKCVPCRVGLNKLSELIDKVLDGEMTLKVEDQEPVVLRKGDSFRCVGGVNKSVQNTGETVTQMLVCLLR